MRFTIFKFGFLFGVLVTAGLTACAGNAPSDGASSTDSSGGYELPSIIQGGRTKDFGAMIADLDNARAVLVGEVHDRFDHHLNQLAVIQQLHRRSPQLAIGMEQFQQPFQSALDRYIAGAIDTETMLIETEYYQRWKLDYRQYEPILSYARQHGIPVIALNLPQELTRKVAADGLKALSEEEAGRIPALDRSDGDYEQRLRQVFDQHPTSEHGRLFENFYSAQLLWDEGMAAQAAAYLDEHPDDRMVILAGEGHVEYGSGIPGRLARRIDGEVATIVHARGDGPDTKRADYVLRSRPVAPPERGLLGVMIDPDGDEARIEDMTSDSAAKAAGIAVGDVITEIDGRAVNGLATLKARLSDKAPGDAVSVTVREGSEQIRDVQVVLR